MPHLIDFDGVEQKLFVLQHLCYGSQKFCEKSKIHRIPPEVGEYEWWEYFGLLKTIVSNTVIECAIKARMVQDFIVADEQDIDLEKLDRDATDGLEIGVFREGVGTLNLRESCNKIVHATEAKLQWVETTFDNLPIEYWSGSYSLWGSKQREKWHVELFLESWCVAMIRFNKSVQETVDWHHVSKYDE